MKKDPWETIYSDNYNDTERLKVPNGWLVKYSVVSENSVSTAMVFIRDFEHTWELTRD